MGKYFDKIMNHTIYKRNEHFQVAEFLLLFVISLLALVARISLIPYDSSDYTAYLSNWYNDLKNAGGIHGIGLSIGDYNPPYLYILSLLTYLPINSLISIKCVSIIFDFISAYFIYKIINIRTNNIQLCILGYTITLFVPTIMLNSSMWGQCDIIYATFIIICLYCLLLDKPFIATIMFSVGFTFKLQAIFFLPVLIMLWSKNKIKLRHFLSIPLVYIISLIPAYIFGRPMNELVSIYFRQSGLSNLINRGATNIYTILEGTEYSNILTISGIVGCCAAILLLLYFIWFSNFRIDNDFIVLISLYISLMVPFLLPRMHERYFFMADILSVIFLFYYPKKYYITLLIIFSSLISYIPFLFKLTVIPIYIGTLSMGVALLILTLLVISFLCNNRDSSIT